MKTIILLIVLLPASAYSQVSGTTEAAEDHNLFLSGGIHAAILGFSGTSSVPYNIHADKLFQKKYVLGAGYSYDRFPQSFFIALSECSRQNFRIRFYKYFRDAEKKVSAYHGLSVGVSLWTVAADAPGYNYARSYYLPSIQYLFGVKVKLSDIFFWQTEIGVGAPYLAQSSIGIKF